LWRYIKKGVLTLEKTFNVAVVGNGNIYNLAHKPAWQGIDRAQVVATCDIIEERAKSACKEFSAEGYYTSIDDLLKNHKSADIVDVCTPSHTHAEISVKSLESGKHVICEKPIATTLEDAQKMIAASKANKRHLYIGHTRRFDDRWVQMKEAIDRGRIGNVVSVRRSECCWVGSPADDWHWERRNGGVILDLGIHIADFSCWFLKEEPTEVFTKAKRISENAIKGGCFDFGVTLVKFEGGKQAIMEVSWVHPKAWGPFNYSSVEVIGTRGKIKYSDKDTNPAALADDSEISFPRYSPMLSSMPYVFKHELGHFLDCIEEDQRPRITLDDAYRALRIVTAAIKSAEEGNPIRIK